MNSGLRMNSELGLEHVSKYLHIRMAWFVINLGFINSCRHMFHSKTFTDIPYTEWHMCVHAARV